MFELARHKSAGYVCPGIVYHCQHPPRAGGAAHTVVGNAAPTCKHTPEDEPVARGREPQNSHHSKRRVVPLFLHFGGLGGVGGARRRRARHRAAGVRRASPMTGPSVGSRHSCAVRCRCLLPAQGRSWPGNSSARSVVRPPNSCAGSRGVFKMPLPRRFPTMFQSGTSSEV